MARSEKFWGKLRSAYRRGEGSIADLAKRFRVPESTVEKRACKEKWARQRQQVGAKAEAKAVERDIDAKVAALTEASTLVGGLLGKARATLEAVDLFDPEGLGQVSSAVARVLPFHLRLAGVDPDRPVVAEGSDQGRTRIIVRGGANVPPEQPSPEGEP